MDALISYLPFVSLHESTNMYKVGSLTQRMVLENRPLNQNIDNFLKHKDNKILQVYGD